MTIEERASEFVNISLHDSIKGAIRYTYIYAATEQHKIDIDKACEWMGENLIGFVEYDELNGIDIDYGQLYRQFRKAMEEMK